MNEQEKRIRAIPVEDHLTSVGPGWASLVEQAYNVVTLNGGYIWDVKEKWGQLRVAYAATSSPYSDDVHDAIWAIEMRSLKVCEVCGRTGKQRPTGWIKTLCFWHYAQWWIGTRPRQIRFRIQQLKRRYRQWRK